MLLQKRWINHEMCSPRPSKQPARAGRYARLDGLGDHGCKTPERKLHSRVKVRVATCLQVTLTRQCAHQNRPALCVQRGLHQSASQTKIASREQGCKVTTSKMESGQKNARLGSADFENRKIQFANSRGNPVHHGLVTLLKEWHHRTTAITKSTFVSV